METGHDATDVRAQAISFPDGIHHFAKYNRILDLLGRTPAMDAGIFLLETPDLPGRRRV